MSTASNTGEYAAKQRLSSKAFIERGSIALSGASTTVNFAEPWKAAPTVYVEAISGSGFSTGSIATAAVGTSSFRIYKVNLTQDPTIKWTALRFTDMVT